MTPQSLAASFAAHQHAHPRLPARPASDRRPRPDAGQRGLPPGQDLPVRDDRQARRRRCGGDRHGDPRGRRRRPGVRANAPRHELVGRPPGPRARPGRRGVPGVRRHDPLGLATAATPWPTARRARPAARCSPTTPRPASSSRPSGPKQSYRSTLAANADPPARRAVRLRPAVLVPGDPRRATYIAETFFDPGARWSTTSAACSATPARSRASRSACSRSAWAAPSAAIYYSELIQLGVQAAHPGRHRRRSSRRAADGRHRGGDQGDGRRPTVGLLTDGEPHAPDGLVAVARGSVAPGPASGRDGARRSDRVERVCSTTRGPGMMQRWKDRGHLAVEMEASVLYTLGAIHGIEALVPGDDQRPHRAPSGTSRADQRRGAEARRRPDDAGRLRRRDR